MFRVIGFAFLLLLTLTACGGEDEPAFTRENVQDTMSEAIRRQLPANTSIAKLQCVEDGDELHWRCITTGSEGSERIRLTVSITCDEETRRCISEPASVAAIP